MNPEKMILAMLTGASHMAFVILLLVFAAAAESPSQNLTLAGCPDTCGDVANILYPFGIGPSCFLDPWYEIDCRRIGVVSTPVLKKLGVVVLEIKQSPCTVTVRQPISYSRPNCSMNPQNDAPINLTASNGVFRYSKNLNYFVAGGCDSLALIDSSDAPWAVEGCKSFCGPNGTLGYRQCSTGIGCCSTTIPKEIGQYSVEFKTLHGDTIAPGDEECRYAFFVEIASWNQADWDSLPPDVPVVLEWAITDHKLPDDDNSVYCQTYNGDSPGDPSLSYCSCQQGYTGNPYIPKGCRDINECKEDPNLNCRGKCVNRPGSYECIHIKIIAMIGTGSGVGAILLLLLPWWLYKCIKRRREGKLKQKFFKRNGGLLLQQRLSSIEDNHMEKGKLFISTELDMATDYFNENRILGRGGQGTVYKGMLMDGTIIAVKKSKVVDAGQVEQFINEVAILSEINHRNVVKLLGFCLESEVPLLVYEFIPNGTLYQYLHDPDREFPISWETRLRIANEVAAALSYLHFAAAIPIYHRDIKSSNILLDEKYRAKVADFGASKSVTIDQTHLTTMVRGTFGYLDPEYYQTSQFTDKSDVYSFGVVLVELLTGEKPISQLRTEEGKNLASYFIISMEEDRLFDVLDKEVADHGEKEEIIAVSNLAKRCLNPSGRHRPTMKELATELERVRSQRNAKAIQQNDEETDLSRGGSILPSSAIHTLMRSEVEVELTSVQDDQSILLPR